MGWTKVCDTLTWHEKVIAAGNEAVGAWVRAMAWSSKKLTNGRIPRAVALQLGDERLWVALREAKAGHEFGLVEELEGGDFQIHDFLRYNPSARKVASNRTAKSEAGKAGARNRWHRDGTHDGKPIAHAMAPVMAEPKQNDAPDPDPDPDPDPKEEAAEAAAAEIRAFVEAIKAQPSLSALDAYEAAEQIATTWRANQIAKGTKLEWALAAVVECGDKAAGAGLNATALAAKLGGYVRNAGPPRPQAPAGGPLAARTGQGGGYGRPAPPEPALAPLMRPYEPVQDPEAAKRAAAEAGEKLKSIIGGRA